MLGRGRHALLLTSPAVCPLLHSGTITVAEMREGLRTKGSKIPQDELELIMQNADVNGDGKVDYEEVRARARVCVCVCVSLAACVHHAARTHTRE
jgi:hypothetical protein